MQNIRLTVEYEGMNYRGWQVQRSPKSKVQSPKLKTIQGVLEEALSRITKKILNYKNEKEFTKFL